MRHVSLCLVTLFVFAACNLSGPDDPLAGFGPRGQMRVTVQTVGPVPAAPYCVEVEIHEPTVNEQGWPQPNTQRANLGPNESKVFDAQVGERAVLLKRAPLTKNGSCAPSPDDLIPDCMIDGEVEAQRALGKWGTVLKRIMVREGRTTEASFTVRCT
jgi:hypothetical protein